jgi:hypothetical protein
MPTYFLDAKSPQTGVVEMPSSGVLAVEPTTGGLRLVVVLVLCADCTFLGCFIGIFLVVLILIVTLKFFW